jgi:hypothetical protein
MSNLRQILHCATSNGVPRRSLAVALVVGTVLNLINQGDVLFSAGRIDWLKVFLTYCVPYLVATYGAVSFQMRLSRSASMGEKP